MVSIPQKWFFSFLFSVYKAKGCLFWRIFLYVSIPWNRQTRLVVKSTWKMWSVLACCLFFSLTSRLIIRRDFLRFSGYGRSSQPSMVLLLPLSLARPSFPPVLLLFSPVPIVSVTDPPLRFFFPLVSPLLDHSKCPNSKRFFSFHIFVDSSQSRFSLSSRKPSYRM